MELTKKLLPEWAEIDYQGEKLGFLLAPLTAAQVLGVGGKSDDLGGAMYYAVLCAVKDWRGFTRNGEEAKFSQAALEQLFADPARHDLLVELANRVTSRARLAPEEQKN